MPCHVMQRVVAGEREQLAANKSHSYNFRLLYAATNFTFDQTDRTHAGRLGHGNGELLKNTYRDCHRY